MDQGNDFLCFLIYQLTYREPGIAFFEVIQNCCIRTNSKLSFLVPVEPHVARLATRRFAFWPGPTKTPWSDGFLWDSGKRSLCQCRQGKGRGGVGAWCHSQRWRLAVCWSFARLCWALESPCFQSETSGSKVFFLCVRRYFSSFFI